MARVLHIEHNPDDREIVTCLLQEAGHDVIEARSGVEAIRLASLHQPDLVLLDIELPDLDGYEVTLRLRGIPSLKQIPIVAMTGQGDRQMSLAVGADGFIAKPVDPKRFGVDLNQFLLGHREFADEHTGEIKLRERSQKIVERLERKVVELSEANARLEEMARLRREFIQNVSHELATPMTPVVGYLRLLLNEELGTISPLQRKCLLAIESSTTRLRSIIDTLLDVSSLETERMHFYERPYDMFDLAVRAVEEVQPRFEQRGVVLIQEPASATRLPARGDADKLRRAMVHVLDNAAKFTPRGGEVAVSVQSSPVQDGVRYTFAVADSGPGVAPSQAAKILEPFYQADGSSTRRHGGVGLGLAFARRVTEAMGGRIEIESPPKSPVAGHMLSGTTVRLTVLADPPRK